MTTFSFGFSDDLFEFNLPDNYANMSYQTMYIFSDTNNSGRGLVIQARADSSVKKSVWDIDKSDLDKLVSSLSYGTNVINTNRRAKLGKEKAVELVISSDGDYIDMYILASNKYIYAVIFTGKSEEELNNSDYKMIKDSFKLKDHTTNFRALYIIFLVIAIGISFLYKNKKGSFNGSSNSSIISNNRNNSKNINNDVIDYKNLTEDDFKRM